MSSDRCSRTLFLDSYSKDHHDHIKIFIHSYTSPVPYPIYSIYDTVGQIMGYCNGIVCIYDLGYIYLINPATRKLRILSPEFLRENSPDCAKHVVETQIKRKNGILITRRQIEINKNPDLRNKHLLENQKEIKKIREKKFCGWSNELTFSVGFGRDIVTGTYKVILVYLFDRKVVKTEALNLENGERRYVCFPISYDRIGNDKRSIFANGSLYCAGGNTSKLIKLAAIDLHTETFRYVSLPTWYTKESKSVYLWSLKDSLCISDFAAKVCKWAKIFSVNILSTKCLDANFWKLSLAAYYFRSTGRNPANNNPLDQIKSPMITAAPFCIRRDWVLRSSFM
ncbi:hypothetical protein ARALYDRAFT_486742, partial [Arabidopsis lyrata subsp. lyrata]